MSSANGEEKAVMDAQAGVEKIPEPEKSNKISDQKQSEETTDTPPGDDTPTMTKSQLKKLRRKEKREAVRGQKRKEEKERAKARKRAMRERGEDVGPSRKQLKHNKMAHSSCQIRVVVDCDFDSYMTDKDIKMLVKQIQFSYSANRRALNPLQFYCCGIGGKTEERLKGLGDYKGWDVRFRRQLYDEVFDKSSIVYLSSDSPNMLDTLQDDKVYIIGGLVDHNHHKGLCHRLAEEKGIAHAQLPISEYINMKTRKVFTINHVFEMLLRYTETQDWQKAFFAVLPSRKGAVPKNLNSCESGVADNRSDTLGTDDADEGGIKCESNVDSDEEMLDKNAEGGEDTDKESDSGDDHDKADNCDAGREVTDRERLAVQTEKCEAQTVNSNAGLSDNDLRVKLVKNEDIFKVDDSVPADADLPQGSKGDNNGDGLNTVTDSSSSDMKNEIDSNGCS